MPLAVSAAHCSRRRGVHSPLARPCSTAQSDPLDANSITMHSSVGVTQAPMKSTTCGWRSLVSSDTSRRKSPAAPAAAADMRFTATSVPWYTARTTSPKAPEPMRPPM